MMIEIRFHGRGGQGAKTAAHILAEAALEEGKYIQAFPEYGPERTGAPMKAFVRIDEKPIRTYQPIVSPDYLIVIDPTLIYFDETLKGINENTIIILNSNKNSEEIKKEIDFKGKIYTIDATGIALKYLKENRSNMPMLAAFVKVSNIVRFETVINKAREHFSKKISNEVAELNIKAMLEVYERVKL